MKKIAFSVWPELENNPIPSNLITIRSTSVKILEDAGFEVIIVEKLNADTDPIMQLILNNYKPEVRYYTKVSDYLRLRAIQEFFDAGYDEVLYFDMDMGILKPPSTYGCAIETHLQQDTDDGKIAKLWMKGVNSCYYLNKHQHQDKFTEHFDLIKKYIKDVNGNCTFCYPMSMLYPIEEGVGFIKDYFHFGTFAEPKFCTPQKILDSVVLFNAIFGDKPEGISAVNMMGSRDLSHIPEYWATIQELNEKIQTLDFSDEAISKILEGFEPRNKLRLRPNYNSHKTRDLIKNFLNKHHK